MMRARRFLTSPRVSVIVQRHGTPAMCTPKENGMRDRIDTSALGSAFKGIVLKQDDGDYDATRRVWNAMIDRRPAVIARCVRTEDVVAALRFGRANQLEIGIRCGGHSIVGHPVPEGGLMIDLSLMNAVVVDPDRRRARVQGGALLGGLDREAQRYGLATTAGNVSHTGVGGLTLAGGMGWLARQFGLSCDNVVSCGVVTADEAVVHVSESDHPDLFWGLRGGGGNFGIVTEFEFCLHPIGGQALVVELFYALDAAQAALQRWRALLMTAPREATLTAWTGTAGDGSYLPRAVHGHRVASVGYVWVGDPGEGRRYLPRLRGDDAPIAERVREMTYVDLQRMDDSVRDAHGVRRYWKGHYLDELSDEAIGVFLTGGINGLALAEDAARMPSADLQRYGGAIGDVADGATAFSHRNALVECVIRARWTDSTEDTTRIDSARRYAAALAPFASGEYVHTVADEGQAGIQRAYSREKFARLVALKDRYDPENIFHLNQNIPPSSQPSS
jgi:FAD/FMN-containing dehydrogenase